MNTFPTPQKLFFISTNFGKRKPMFFSVNFTQICTKKIRVVFIEFCLPQEGEKDTWGGKIIHHYGIRLIMGHLSYWGLSGNE
jgi:hypothetical protein